MFFTLTFIHRWKLKSATKICSHAVGLRTFLQQSCSALSWARRAWSWQPLQVPGCAWRKQSRQVYVKLGNLTTVSRGECRRRDYLICILSHDRFLLFVFSTKNYFFLNSHGLLTLSTKQGSSCPQGGRQSAHMPSAAFFLFLLLFWLSKVNESQQRLWIHFAIGVCFSCCSLYAVI